MRRSDVHAAKAIGAAGRQVEAAEDVHRRGLARAARTHDRDELAWHDLEVDAGQRVNRGLAAAVRPHDVLECDDSVPSWRISVRAREIDDHRRAAAQLAAAQHRHLPSVGPISTWNRLEASPDTRQTRGWPSSSERSRRCEPGGRGSSRKPAAALRLLRRRRRESQRGVRHEQRIGHVRDRDFRRRGHTGLQQALGVVDAQDRLIGHDAIRRLRRAADLADLRRERSIRDTRRRGSSRACPTRTLPMSASSTSTISFILVRSSGKREQRRRLKGRRHGLTGIDLPVEHDAADRRADDRFLDVGFDGGQAGL